MRFECPPYREWGSAFLLEAAISWRKGGEISIVFNGEETLGIASRRVPGGLSRRYRHSLQGKELR